jgi:hypothetical protein
VGSRSTSIALFAGALCALLATLRFLRSDELRSAPDGGQLSSSVRAVRIAPTRIEVSATNQPVAAPSSRVPRAQVKAPHQSLPTPMVRALEDVGLSVPPSLAALETEKTFSAEAVDPLWSVHREADINDAIAQVNGLELITLQVECRTSLCRLQLTQRVSGPIAQRTDAVMSFYGKVFDWLGVEHQPPVMLAVDGSGIATSLVYLPRH